MRSLGTLPGGDDSRALSINETGEVVGTSTSSLGLRAVLWTRTGGMQDLNASIPPHSGFVLTAAVGINNRGEIVAIGHDDDGHGHGHGHVDHDIPARIVLLVPRP